jgi:DNA-binding transcriptional regulator YhcF (GntR family)
MDTPFNLPIRRVPLSTQVTDQNESLVVACPLHPSDNLLSERILA